MIRFIPRLLALAAALALAAPAAAQLQRRAFLGVSMAPDAQTGEGATVTAILPGGTAERLGLRAGDMIVQAGGAEVRTPADIAAFVSRLRGGARAELLVRRAGRALRLRAPAAEYPRETHAGARVDYGAVPWRGGHLRDILAVPEGVARPPVVFLIQGYSCVTMESNDPAHAYRRLGTELLARGIAYYRVEKPGVGDSTGTPHCMEIDYSTELDAFRAAYRQLIARGFEPERIFMLGHSLGGLQAPMLAAEQAPRGIAVYGTLLRNWADYHRDISQFQLYLMAGGDLAEQVAVADSYRDLFRRFYFEDAEPAALAAESPAFERGLRESFNWDGGVNVFGRHYRFNRELAHLPLIAAWRDAHTNVLAIYGEADLVALNDQDHKLIADVADFYRPGSGRYVEVPRTGHGMDLIGSRREVREAMRGGGTPPQGPFNPEVARLLAEWIGEAMARPPVRPAGPSAP